MEKALKRLCFKAFIWWSIAGSNRWPLQCHWSALPTELIPLWLASWCVLLRTERNYHFQSGHASFFYKKIAPGWFFRKILNPERAANPMQTKTGTVWTNVFEWDSFLFYLSINDETPSFYSSYDIRLRSGNFVPVLFLSLIHISEPTRPY
mgnify:CR=1 FL=1